MSKTSTAVGLWLIMAIASLAIPQTAIGTSAQIEISEPSLPVTEDRIVHGTAFFGVLAGSDIFDTAGSLAGTFRAGSIGSGDLYFFADIFTWIENGSVSEFNPRRVVYTLEPGYHISRGADQYRLFVKHQSFHDIDFTDTLDESYELYGVSYRRLGRLGFELRVGKYLNRKVVDYDWDITASATCGLRPIRGRNTYVHAWLHHVTEDDGPGDRDGFTDYAGEAGIIYLSGITLFVRYEFLHDIDAFGGISDHHAIIGTKYNW